ncbi:OmpP1/FadL family transporter [Mucilaginibacter segetis]|uniref:Long-subunit fatty acid transport protein n=1 Tax=Mucilaginibacter segetis TaxID=2793071 RepID=A0A934PSI6_9SPHI|nr:hypothetical protein [Mucilaginibacter segetis]MBK0378702.1 hypothetical protein [Mucilaginibacter segetis]
MKIKYILSVIAIVAITKTSFAQYSQDAIRFSTGETGSTARIKGVGNAGTAVGGDLSSVSGNPAGLGFFTSSELSITPEYNNTKVNSTFLGQGSSDTKSSGNLNHGAFVIYQQVNKPRGADRTKGWLSVNYGGGYSRTNNYYENINYFGTNNTSSINDYYADQANSFGTSQGTLARAALDHNLIDLYDPANPVYKSNAYPGVDQESSIIRSGGLSNLDFAVGGNYSNKFYIGLGVSFTNIRYNSLSRFYEDGTASVLENSIPTDRDYNSAFTQDQVTKGSGFNARLGVIFKPVEALRLGATITSPTWYNIDDSYSESLDTRLSNGNSYEYGPQNYSLNYNLRTPLKVAGGAAVFIKKYGFITGDIEYVDYSSAHLSSNDSYYADDDNMNIKTLYQSTINAHIGAEARINSMFLLRGGYGIQGDPQKNYGGDIKTVSGGIGLRFGAYYMDAAYTHSTGNKTIFPYEIGSLSPGAQLDKITNNGYLTLGYRF